MPDDDHVMTGQKDKLPDQFVIIADHADPSALGNSSPASPSKTVLSKIMLPVPCHAIMILIFVSLPIASILVAHAVALLLMCILFTADATDTKDSNSLSFSSYIL